MKTRVSLKYFVADCWLRGMLSWVLLKFILVIYSNASQLTYFLIGPLAMARRVIGIKSVRPSVWRFSWNWLFLFLELKMELGAHVMLCMTAPNFLEIIFCPKNGENRPSLGFFECIGKFSFFSRFFDFFSILSIMKVFIILIAICLNKIHIWENSGPWDMAQDALGQSDCGNFQWN